MYMQSLSDLILPSHELSGLPIEYQKRIPYIIRANIALLFYFAVSSASRFVEDPATNWLFFAAVLVVTVVFLLSSLLLIRQRRFVLAAYLTGICILINVNNISFLLPVLHELEIYRMVGFLLAFLIVNNLVALTARQVLWVGVAGSLVSFAAYIVLRQIPAANGDWGAIPTLTIIGVILVLMIGYTVLLQQRFASNLVSVAETQRDRAQAQLHQLQKLVLDSRSDLQIGEKLQESSDAGRAQGTVVALSVQQLEQKTTELAAAAEEVEQLTVGLTQHSRIVREAMELQGSNMEETSASIIQINATVQNLSGTSSEKQALVSDLSQQLSEQEQQMTTALAGMERVQSSSREMIQIISSILDISEQTGILAINASIEAAHSGAEGRGFGVIASEIRKLAIESRTNADRISRSISENNAVVQSATEQFTSFSRGMVQVSERFREVLQVLQVVSSGLAEISTGTQQIQEATQQLVASSYNTNDAVEHTLADVSRQEQIAASLREYADTVAEQVHGLDTASKEIELRLADIHRIGRENAERMVQLNRELDRVSAGATGATAE